MAQMTYTIPDSKLDEFKAAFLAVHPVPLTQSGGEPKMTENEWIKEWGRRQFLNAYKNGKHTLAMNAAAVDNEIVE